jgi:hypothetical protein
MRRTIIIATALQLSGFALAFLNKFKWGYAVDLLALGVFQGMSLILCNSVI